MAYSCSFHKPQLPRRKREHRYAATVYRLYYVLSLYISFSALVYTKGGHDLCIEGAWRRTSKAVYRL